MNYTNKDVLSKKKQILLSLQVKNDIDFFGDYETLKENINIYQIKDYQEIIIYLDSLINKL